MQILRKFIKSQSGTTLVEYGVALILVVVVGGAVISGLAGAIGDELTETASAF